MSEMDEIPRAERIWMGADWLVGLVAAFVAGVVYFWTAAPNVTLLDSGEFVVAAQHFGVPHPTGYPLWTLLAWLFQLLPLGNAAWEINLFSGFCGALATGLVAMLFSSSTRWMLGGQVACWRGLNVVVSLTVALLFAFSASMWSQAVIAEVYTLHALLIGFYLTSLYVWLRRPESLWLLMLPFFLLALSFSNHQLSVALAPLPFLVVLLVRRGIFWDLVVAGAMTVLVAYLGFAILSGEAPVLKTAIRFFYCVMAGFVLLVVVRRMRVEWRLVAYLPFVVALGLLPYAYMPLASSTNPPMNWAYTRTPEGFFFSFNRSQYGGSLTQQSLRSLGKLMGTAPGSSSQNEAPQPGIAPHSKGVLAELQDWVGFFWLQLGRSFTPLGVVAYFAALLVVLRLKDVAARTWIYVLEIAFVLAAILQPVADGAQTDVGGWWLQMPYHTYTNLIFALLAGLGFMAGALWFCSRAPRLAWMRYAMLALPLWPLFFNYDSCSQRGRWFGWDFGHDMLRDLPLGSVVLGGTDPGRFVPTYMILGESTQPPDAKRDPDFDRRDLYIITQNGVGEPLYRKYLADHYGAERPKPRNAFERWLGRADAYPEKPLVFPTEQEINDAVSKEMDASMAKGTMDPSLPHSVVTRLIWEKNRDSHEFFVEESFPMEWSYDHAEPHGLVYRINRESLKEIPPDLVRKDFEFWDAYVRKLKDNPEYAKDYDAQRSFSKLRASSGNLYRYRKMDAEAERAYRQALELWQGNGESLNALNSMLWDRGDFDAVLAMLQPALDADPNNIGLWQMYFITEKRKELQGAIAAGEESVAKQPASVAYVQKLLELYASAGETNKVSDLLGNSIPLLAKDAAFLRVAAEYGEAGSLPESELLATKALVAVEPDVAENQLALARAALRNHKKEEFFAAARAAVEKGGLPMREAFAKSTEFDTVRNDPEFQEILGRRD
jgi:tetratricopeptide (TPR) repeat protein